MRKRARDKERGTLNADKRKARSSAEVRGPMKTPVDRSTRKHTTTGRHVGTEGH